MSNIALATTTVTFTNSVNDLIDPTTVSLKYRSQDSYWVSKSYSGDITRSSQGVYTYEIPCAVTGNWFVEWYGATPDLEKVIKTSFSVSN
jgi:hypothetical protein